MLLRFNSLQTGRHIQTFFDIKLNLSQCVSIPFKREGTFRLKGKSWKLVDYSKCFNSLQTGRHIQTEEMNESFRNKIRSFNSLQTGRHIQTVLPNANGNDKVFKVSIPFKREGTFRRTVPQVFEFTVEESFNSLQTGRHIQTLLSAMCVMGCFGFHSLQTGRHIQTK